MATSPQDVFKMIKEHDVKILDLRFMDFPGLWQHFSLRIDELEESSFEDGFGFDGDGRLLRGFGALQLTPPIRYIGLRFEPLATRSRP